MGHRTPNISKGTQSNVQHQLCSFYKLVGALGIENYTVNSLQYCCAFSAITSFALAFSSMQTLHTMNQTPTLLVHLYYQLLATLWYTKTPELFLSSTNETHYIYYNQSCIQKLQKNKITQQTRNHFWTRWHMSYWFIIGREPVCVFIYVFTWIHMFCLLLRVLNEFDTSHTGSKLVVWIHSHVSPREKLAISRETCVDTPNLFTESGEFTWIKPVECNS